MFLRTVKFFLVAGILALGFAPRAALASPVCFGQPLPPELGYVQQAACVIAPPKAPDCPDGYLTAPASKTDPWYGITVDIPNGVTKKYCAPIQPPLINFHPNFITFSWYDVSDADCAGLNIRVDAVDPPPRPLGGSAGYSASGTLNYYRRVGPLDRPEQTAPGIYVITLKGGNAPCFRYRIAWKATL